MSSIDSNPFLVYQPKEPVTQFASLQAQVNRLEALITSVFTPLSKPESQIPQNNYPNAIWNHPSQFPGLPQLK